MGIRRGEQFWLEHVRAWQRSGLGQKPYCRQAGLCPSTFYSWARRYGQSSGSIAIPGFVQAKLDMSSGHTLGAAAASNKNASRVDGPALALGNNQGWRLEFANLPPTDWLGQLLRGMA